MKSAISRLRYICIYICIQYYRNNHVENMHILGMITFTLAPIEACEVNAFGSVCLSICLPVCACHSKTFPTIDLIFTQEELHFATFSSPSQNML